jgi:hypothetical protein
MAAIVPMPPDEQERLQTAKERLQAQQERLRRYRSGEPVWGAPQVLLIGLQLLGQRAGPALPRGPSPPPYL